MDLILKRQIGHWLAASKRLSDFNWLASEKSWSGLETYTGIALRDHLLQAVHRLIRDAERLDYQAKNTFDHEAIKKELLILRRKYQQTEVTLDFFGDAINSRTSSKVAKILSGLDQLAQISMFKTLNPMGKRSPKVLTYLDKGLGASILKAGLRLWDGGTINPVAAIKIVRHNLLRPTALIHETGHQVAHMLNWNAELKHALKSEINWPNERSGDIWSSWASEIAADAYAFAHTGYAAVANLHDVLSGGANWIFHYTDGDPHPIPYLRVILNIAWCQLFFKKGPWDEMMHEWMKRYPLAGASNDVRYLIKNSFTLVPSVAKLVMARPMQAFGGQSLMQMLDLGAVHPLQLMKMDAEEGASLFQKPIPIYQNGLQLLALSGWKIATNPKHQADYLEELEQWLQMQGESVLENAF